MRSKLVFISSIVLFTFSCNPNRSASLREAVLMSFDCLQNLQQKDFGYYRDRMVNFADLKDILNNDSIPKTVRKEYSDSINSEKIVNELEKSFNELRKSALEFNLICKDFQYIDYTSESKTETGINSFEGTIHFSHKGDMYLVDFFAFKIQDKYKIAALEKLRPKPHPDDGD